MKVKKNLAATIVAMTAISGATVSEECAAARAAIADMKTEMGAQNVYELSYTWDPFHGLVA